MRGPNMYEGGLSYTGVVTLLLVSLGPKDGGSIAVRWLLLQGTPHFENGFH